MSTQVAVVEEVTGVEEMERRLVAMDKQVEREKVKTRDTFQQVHSLLDVGEGKLLKQLDGIVLEARQELKDKMKVLEALRSAKESTKRELKKENKLKGFLEKHLCNTDDKIMIELSKPLLNVNWVEVKWKREGLEQFIAGLYTVERMNQVDLISQSILDADDKWDIPESDLEIMEKIGKGGYGYVYKGYMQSRSTHVAIKMCKSDSLTDQDEFLREAEIMKQFRHPNIVEFIGVTQGPEFSYIIMELMSGEDFLTFLRNKAIREKKHVLTRMVLDVAEGMTYLSSKDCVHGELTANNCLIGESKSVKISNLWMSLQLSDEREGIYPICDTFIQQPSIKHTAPEALSYGVYTSQSDVWSYGILLWQTFSCGYRPYPGMDYMTVVDKLETGFRMPAPTDTPPAVYELMRQCWEYNSLDRPNFQKIVCVLKNIIQELTSRNV